MAKKCKYNLRFRCFWFSCSFVDAFGNVRVCKYHPNPSGFNNSRSVKRDLGFRVRRS